MKRIMYLVLVILIVLVGSFPVFAGSEFLCSDVTEIPQSECEALVAFYNSTNGPGWTDNSGWLVSNRPSEWYRVGVSSGHVTSIYLNSNKLSGSIPAELGNLTQLIGLVLTSNYLTGSIPPSLGNLINLVYLRLDFNQLSGSIPSELGNLANLTELWLEDNQLTGDVPATLINLVNLKTNTTGLDMRYNLLNVPPGYPDPNDPFQVFLYQKDAYWHLYQLKPFVDCSLVVEISPTECEALVTFYNSTNGPGWLISKYWLVTDTPSSWHGVEVGSGQVTRLDLGSNQLTGSIPAELGNLTNLTQLSLDNNQLTGSLSPWLGNLTNLLYLYLSHNHLSGNIPPSLGYLINLQVMHFEHNQFTGNIPPELGNLVNLVGGIFLNNNQLSGSLPSEMGNLVNLFYLDLSHNHLSGNLPPSFGNLSNLQGLYLNDNQLTGSLPSELGNLVHLSILRLNNNHFEGDIPGTLVNLTYLNNPGMAWDGGDGLDLDYNTLNIPPGYPDPGNPLHVFLYQKDPDWHLRQHLIQSLFLPVVRR